MILAPLAVWKEKVREFDQRLSKKLCPGFSNRSYSIRLIHESWTDFQNSKDLVEFAESRIKNIHGIKIKFLTSKGEEVEIKFSERKQEGGLKISPSNEDLIHKISDAIEDDLKLKHASHRYAFLIIPLFGTVLAKQLTGIWFAFFVASFTAFLALQNQRLHILASKDFWYLPSDSLKRFIYPLWKMSRADAVIVFISFTVTVILLSVPKVVLPESLEFIRMTFASSLESITPLYFRETRDLSKTDNFESLENSLKGWSIDSQEKTIGLARSILGVLSSEKSTGTFLPLGDQAAVFIEFRPFDPTNMIAEVPLLSFSYDTKTLAAMPIPKDLSHSANLIRRDFFSKWWNGPIIKLSNGKVFSRRRLVQIAAYPFQEANRQDYELVNSRLSLPFSEATSNGKTSYASLSGRPLFAMVKTIGEELNSSMKWIKNKGF